MSKQNHIPKEFAFIEVAENGRVTDKKHLHTIQRHIMKDIGKARRKKVLGSKAAGEQIPSISQRTVDDVVMAEPRRDKTYSIRRSWSLGSGRLDPFACYPVQVDDDMLFLLD